MNCMQDQRKTEEKNSRHLIIQKTIDFVKATLHDAEAGHDWWHIRRVWKNTQLILKQHQADRLVCELAALLHDVADAKFHNGDEEIGPQIATKFLQDQALDPALISQVVYVIRHLSYKNSLEESTPRTPELDVVQDADRLDAMGAIGIARAFHYGGYKNREIYNPAIPAQIHLDKESYKTSNAPTINHFHEKLLRLKDLMNTSSAKQMAEQRHIFMEAFLQQFYAEWGDANEV